MNNPFLEDLKNSSSDNFDKKNNKIIGGWGEDIAENFLKKKGFCTLDRNYAKKWGEIDIIVRDKDRVHFVEVKTVSYETKGDLKQAVTRGTYRPEEKVDKFKLEKISRVAEAWILERKFQGDWQIDVVAVRIVPREKYALVKYLDNIIL